MPEIIVLNLWEDDKSKKKIAQFNSFDEMPVASNNIIEILDKKYKILSIRRNSKNDFTNHHKTTDNEIYEIIVENV